MKRKSAVLLLSALICFLVLFGCSSPDAGPTSSARATSLAQGPSSSSSSYEVSEPSLSSVPINTVCTPSFDLSSIPPFDPTKPYVEINGNCPFFTDEDITTDPVERYSPLDELGRCGPAYANVCKEIMPNEERGEIGPIKPSGWRTIRYNGLIDGNYLYNRCHLIGYQLSGENANPENLITGTRFLNVQGMLPFETRIADYVKATGNHVLYRVTPIFDGENLLASGVLMEALSVEDEGAKMRFCVYAYNAQPYITIDYLTGDSYPDGNAVELTYTSSLTPLQEESKIGKEGESDYIANKNTKKFHLPSCSSVKQMKESNKLFYTGSRDDLIAQGYAPCKRCGP